MKDTCIACMGTGIYDDDGAPPCGSCNGTGEVTLDADDLEDHLDDVKSQLATMTADRDALQSKLARALSEYDRMNAALNRDPSGQDWLVMRDCLRESEKQLAECRAEIQRLKDETQRLLAMQLGDQWKLTDQIQRMTAIVEAAKAWHGHDRISYKPAGACCAACDLHNAVDAALAPPADTGAGVK